jgi:hypothetical protein
VKTVSLKQVGYEELALSPHVQEALGELVGSANAGLLALSVGLGLAVLAELLEEEVVEVVGPKGKKHIPERTAVRHGHEAGEVTLGGRRVAVERPRVRTADGRAEVRLRTCEYFTDRDPLSRAVPERMLAGVSTRRYRRTPAPVGQDVEQRARSTSESSVSHPTQCEALVVRRDGAALDRRRHVRSRTAVSEDHRLPRPRHPRHRDRTRPRTAPSRTSSPCPDRGGRYHPRQLTITQGHSTDSTAGARSSAGWGAAVT